MLPSCVHQCNLLEARMIVTIYNQQARLPPSPLVGLRLQSLLGPGRRHCYGIITPVAPCTTVLPILIHARPLPTRPDRRYAATGKPSAAQCGVGRPRDPRKSCAWKISSSTAFESIFWRINTDMIRVILIVPRLYRMTPEKIARALLAPFFPSPYRTMPSAWFIFTCP